MRGRRVLAGLALAVCGGALCWRWASRRRNLPCPVWLAPRAGTPLYEAFLRTRATLQELGLRPGLRVLEVGAGWGRLAVPAAQRIEPGGTLVALDLQPAMLRRLRAAAAGIGNLLPVAADATRLPFRPATFDLAYLCTVLGEIPDREAALRGCYDALRPNGRLSITEILPDPHYQSRGTVLRMAAAAGFRPASVRGSWRHFTATFVKPACDPGH